MPEAYKIEHADWGAPRGSNPSRYKMQTSFVNTHVYQLAKTPGGHNCRSIATYLRVYAGCLTSPEAVFVAKYLAAKTGNLWVSPGEIKGFVARALKKIGGSDQATNAELILRQLFMFVVGCRYNLKRLR